MSQPSSQHQLIENHTVDYVPPAERHGKARDLFSLWFSTNIALASARGRRWASRKWFRAAGSSAAMARC